MQAISKTLLVKQLPINFYNNSLLQNVPNNNLDCSAVIAILCYMCNPNNYNTRIPDQMVQLALDQVCSKRHFNSLELNKQNDVFEFINSFLSILAESIGEDLTVLQTFSCPSCGNTKESIDRLVMCLTISCEVPVTNNVFTINDLVSQNCEQRISDVTCDSCPHLYNLCETITKLPMTLFVVLKRYTFLNTRSVKLRSEVFASVSLNLNSVLTYKTRNTDYVASSVITEILQDLGIMLHLFNNEFIHSLLLSVMI